MVECSQTISEYFSAIDSAVSKEYLIAEKARSLGFDPEPKVDIPLARSLAERVEGLVSAVAHEISGQGIPEKIGELEKQYGVGDWRVALKIGEFVAKQEKIKFESQLKALEVGIRVGLAYLTNGVVSAPLEGFIEVKEKNTKKGTKYISVLFGGPIRAAGGTAAAVCVLIADYLRRVLGYDAYDPDENEIGRYQIELDDYHTKVSRLQYFPSNPEIEFLIKNIPVEINGDPTSEKDVSKFKDLPRVETNQIRGGACLVIGEGIGQKGKKILPRIEKWGKEFGLEHWLFLAEFLDLQKKILSTKENEENHEENSHQKIKPNYRYISETVAGRPVFSFPLANGGFRLRYGRTRLSGLAAAAVNPSTMKILDNFIATGTQLKVERPGKACAITPCESIRGPVVRLTDGSVLRVDDSNTASSVCNKVEKILFLGDILFCYGDFEQAKHSLLPSPYVEEWWIKDVTNELGSPSPEKLSEKTGISLETSRKLFSEPFFSKPSADEAFKISKSLNVPLHPEYTFAWSQISKQDIVFLAENIIPSERLSFTNGQKLKSILELLGAPHCVDSDKIILSEEYSKALLISFGYFSNSSSININKIRLSENTFESSVDFVNSFSDVPVKDTATVFIGARMGRPEKAKLRTMTGRPHCLFPCGVQGGRLRSFNSASETGHVESDFPIFFCESCKLESIYPFCESCNSKTIKRRKCSVCSKITPEKEHCSAPTSGYSRTRIDINSYIKFAEERLDLKVPELVKGVRGTSNKDHIPEAFEKGLLRAHHGVFVNKDGTIRLDMIETPVTHFKPCEINAGVEKLKSLGYKTDCYGSPLENENQLVELFPQDIIIPCCTDWQGANLASELVKACAFVDSLLERFYKLEPYYNVRTIDDLIGVYGIALAPHTSAGTVCRIIGFSKTQGFYAHPFLHSACRRNCDGDELGFMLLLDALLNFSRQYLPDKRGSRTMDAPLVLSANIDPNEIDDEVHGMDVAWSYPLEFYTACSEYKQPWDVKVEQVKSRLGKKSQFEGLGFTHPVSDINSGALVSSYKTLITMFDKVSRQMNLADKIRAVSSDSIATLVIEKHFLRDIKGNMRKFSAQEFRCVKCNAKYRRVPLSTVCKKCGGRIIFTISEGSISKYLEHSINLAEKYRLSNYLCQSLNLLKRRIESVFGRETEKQLNLSQFS